MASLAQPLGRISGAGFFCCGGNLALDCLGITFLRHSNLEGNWLAWTRHFTHNDDRRVFFAPQNLNLKLISGGHIRRRQIWSFIIDGCVIWNLPHYWSIRPSSHHASPLFRNNGTVARNLKKVKNIATGLVC